MRETATFDARLIFPPPGGLRFTHRIDQLAAEAHVGMQDAVPPERNRSLVRLLGHGTE